MPPLTAGTLPLGAAERGAIIEFALWLRERFVARVSELSLFGSRARGEAHEESDVDHGSPGLAPRELGEIQN